MQTIEIEPDEKRPLRKRKFEELKKIKNEIFTKSQELEFEQSKLVELNKANDKLASKQKEIENLHTALESDDTEECARLRKEVLHFKHLPESKSLIKQDLKNEIVKTREESKFLRDMVIANVSELEADKKSLNEMKQKIELSIEVNSSLRQINEKKNIELNEANKKLAFKQKEIEDLQAEKNIALKIPYSLYYKTLSNIRPSRI